MLPQHSWGAKGYCGNSSFQRSRTTRVPARVLASPCQGMRSHGTTRFHSLSQRASQLARDSSFISARSRGRYTKARVRICAHCLAKADSLAPSQRAILAGPPLNWPTIELVADPRGVLYLVSPVVRFGRLISYRRSRSHRNTDLLKVGGGVGADVQELHQGHEVGVENIPAGILVNGKV